MVQSLESFTSSNYTIINQQANNEQAKQTISFKMPSEAQMIDAVAIYLAKRVKQEAVLWFFENITKNANKFELLRTIFPSTISLLQSKEVYETPNMGSQWHYALSKDFVTLPKNMLNSTWLEKRIPDEKKEILNNLKELPQIAKLINQRYNYQDLVRNMYLELKDTNTSNDTNIKIKDIFTLLYAINNEMNIYSNTKVKDSLSVRKLRYEDFRNINKEEFVIMLSLIDMKYDGIFSKMLKLNTQGEFNLDATQVEQIRKWLGRIQLGIEQLDKVRTEYIQEQKRSESSDKKATIYNSCNIWLFMSELFKLIIPANGSNWLNTTTIRTAESFKYIEQVNEIYNLISTNNFSGSVNSTIDLIDSLFYNNKSKVYKKSFTEIRNLVLDKFKDYQYLTDIVNCIYILKQNITNSNDSIKYSNLKIYFLSSNYTQTKNHNDTIEYYKLKINTCKNKITNNSDKLNTFYIEIGIKKDESNSDTISFERNSQFAALLFEQNRHALIIIRKLGGFLNDVSLAKDSKQLSKVVESYALPPGSYKQKRNKWWSLDLNSFVGPYFGYEFPIKNKILPDAYKASKVYGLSAQIGITISTTIGRKVKIKDTINTDWIKNPDRIKIKNRKISLKTNNTLSLTVSLIDLGAVVSYRLSNSDSILPHDPKWAQIISPGIHIAYGIKNTPLVIQGGFQYTPQLRKIDDKSIRQYNASRIYIGLMFDMPLFNLWSRDRIAY